MNFKKEAMNHGYPFVNLQDIFDKNIINDFNLGLADSSEKQREEYNLKKGDILFVRSSVKPEGVGVVSLVPYDFINTTYSGFIIRFRVYCEMIDEFKRFVLSSEYVRKQILTNATSSANTNINQETLQKIQVKLPNLDEQIKISTFIMKIEDLITLYHRKKSSLTHVFEHYKINLTTNTQEYFHDLKFQKRKLDDLCEYKSSTRSANQLELLNKGYNIYNANSLIGKIDTFDMSDRYISIIKDGAGVGRINKLPKNTSIIGTMGYIIPNSKIVDFDYFYYFLSSINFTKYITGTTIPHIYFKDYKIEKINLPNLKTQKVIGTLLLNIEDSLNMINKKIDVLYRLKKTLLQNMFI